MYFFVLADIHLCFEQWEFRIRPEKPKRAVTQHQDFFFPMGGGTLNDLYTTYVTNRFCPEVSDGMVSPPFRMFLQPGLPGA